MTYEVENILAKRGFVHKSNESYSYIYTMTWENNDYEFIIVGDRGYYEAFIKIKDENNIGGEIIKFIRRISNNSQLFEEDLKKTDRHKTLQPKRYAEILDQFYDEIDQYREIYQDIKIKYNVQYPVKVLEKVKETNKFWRSVELRCNVIDSNTIILSQKRLLNFPNSIFKLGQKIGHENCRDKMIITILGKARKVEIDSNITKESNRIKIITEYGVIKIYKGVLQDADSYMIGKISNRIEGEYKDEIIKTFFVNNLSSPGRNREIGYLTFDNQLLFFKAKKGDLIVLAVYQISIRYE